MPNISSIQALSLVADTFHRYRRDPPIAPDGLYDWQAGENADTSKEGHSVVTNVISWVKALQEIKTSRPLQVPASNFQKLVSFPGEQDDRAGVFQGGLDLLSKMPEDSRLGKVMANTAVGLLYNTIPHPPDAYLGPELTFRKADGGCNNIHQHDLGRGGTKYARSVQPKKSISSSSLPDPGLIFDTLLKARDRVDHRGGNSSLTFAFASIVTHSLFRTDHRDINTNETSSYLDLSPLYGHDQAAQDSVRNKASGRGHIWPDTFAEERLLFVPPAASALLIIFSRNHNYIADMLLKINEKKRWRDPPPNDPKDLAKQDEEIFQTARLVNGGHFMAMIMGDYVSGFLGLSEGNAWNMDAFDPIKLKGDKVIGRGDGNHVSVEFNLLYRWHTTLSEEDEKWTEKFFGKVFDNKPADQITLPDFGASIMKVMNDIDPEPKRRTFAGLERGPNGKFSDDDLARILHDATESPAGQYRARGTPGVLRIIEILGIKQSRDWGVCTMNEFRKFLGLKQFASFEEWNPDPEIAGAARRLYHHIDNLELYTGLQCESIMPLSEGLRFSCGYTMTQAVLSDAIALIRGDRFYTTDYSPASMTSWGFQDCERDQLNGGSGGALPKLLMRHLPRHYPYNNVYGVFPFFTPKKMEESLTRQGIAAKYAFGRPVATPYPVILNDFTAIKHAFSDPTRFKSVYELKGLGNGYGFILAHDEKEQHLEDRTLLLHALFPTKESLSKYVDWYRDMTDKGVKTGTWEYDGVKDKRYVDIVDVINTIAVHWAADKLCGISLKTKENPRGLYTVQEVYTMFADLFTAAFLSIGENEQGFALRQKAAKAGLAIQAMVAKSVLEIAPTSVTNPWVGAFNEIVHYFRPPSEKPCYEFLSKLAETGRPANELIANVVGLANGTSVNEAQSAVHVIDFYFDEKHEKERIHILQLVQTDDGPSNDLLRGYVREAMRLNPQFTGLWRGADVDAEIPTDASSEPIRVKKGDRIWASFRNAHVNPKEFPEPDKVDPTRPRSLYNLNGAGFHNCPGVTFAERTIAEILKVVFSLKNVRRAEGDAGKLVGITRILNETETNFYIRPNGTLSYWPTSMHLVYDA